MFQQPVTERPERPGMFRGTAGKTRSTTTRRTAGTTVQRPRRSNPQPERKAPGHHSAEHRGRPEQVARMVTRKPPQRDSRET
jgi:hypothetical protein